jgi:hypothetical protein
VLVCYSTHDQILLKDDKGQVTRFAGTGPWEACLGDVDETGAPRLAAKASLRRPRQMVVTARGEVVFADRGGNTIRRIRPVSAGASDYVIETLLDLDQIRQDQPDFANEGSLIMALAEDPMGNLMFALSSTEVIGLLAPSGSLKLMPIARFRDSGAPVRPDISDLYCAVGAATPGHLDLLSNGRLWRIPFDAPPVALTGSHPDAEWDAGPVTAGRAAILPGMFPSLAPAPGGGHLICDAQGRYRYVGSSKGDADLWRRVEAAVECYRTGDTPGGDKIVGNLRLWATYPKTAKELQPLYQGLGAATKHEMDDKVAKVLQAHAATFNYDQRADYGKAFRALLALHAIQTLKGEMGEAQEPPAKIPALDSKAGGSSSSSSSSSSSPAGPADDGPEPMETGDPAPGK